MKKGINIWSFPGDMKVRDCMDLAKRAGFEGIELAMSETGELSLESSIQEVRGIKKAADDTGIELAGFASLMYWSCPITSSDSATRVKAKEHVKKQIEFAAELGVDTILVIPGIVGADFIPGLEPVEYDVAYDRAMEAISGLAAVAKNYKVTMGIENVWNKFLLSPLEMRDFIDKINSEYVGAYFDVGNVVATGYPEHWIKILGKRIKKVHFKDYRREVGGLAGFVDLLAGDVDYPKVMKGLREIGYSGYVIGEMIPPYKHHSSQIIYNTSGSMDAILGR